MHFTREIYRLSIGIAVTFCMVFLVAAYWAVMGSNTILQREDNPRLFEAQARIVRGDIVDRDGESLVITETFRGQRPVRAYLHPSTYSLTGYYSLRYGVAGVEAAFNSLLNGDSRTPAFWDQIVRDLMHEPQQGYDVQLTVDLDTQKTLDELMQGQTGAAVVLSVPHGEIVAIASQPTYDPNTLDADWESLIVDQRNPFFNRALQGNYQPGEAMYTLLVTTALINGADFSIPFENADEPIFVGDVLFSCTTEPPQSTLTLADAYVYGCPAPFARYINEAGLQSLSEIFRTVLPAQSLTLSGFLTNEPLPQTNSKQLTIEDLFGQGDIQFTPISMAAIIAAAINGGNAPQPTILYAYRAPDSEEWIRNQAVRTSQPITTPEIAQRVKTMMLRAVNEGVATHATQPDLQIGGHSALAYSGEQSLSWFIGIVQTGERQGYAIALVIENTDDLDLAATIGGEILRYVAGA